MRLLPGRLEAHAAEIAFDDVELTSLTEHEMCAVRGSRLAAVFQDPLSSLNPTKSIGDQVAEPLLVHRRCGRREARERAVELLARVGVPSPRERARAFPHQLSGGLRQRVCIAMALAAEPKLLIADEPTTALDVSVQAQILELLDDLRAGLGMALLLITHDLGVIAGRADRVLVMYAGRIVETAPTFDLFAAPQHPYTRALLDAVPRADDDSRSGALPIIPGSAPDLRRPTPGCRFAPRCSRRSDRCTAEEPALTRAGAAGAAACWHPLTGGALSGRA
jgi:peptide/nickel transport system ATP-binding protein